VSPSHGGSEHLRSDGWLVRGSASVSYERDEGDWKKEKVALVESQSAEVPLGVVSLAEGQFGREETAEA